VTLKRPDISARPLHNHLRTGMHEWHLQCTYSAYNYLGTNFLEVYEKMSELQTLLSVRRLNVQRVRGRGNKFKK